MLVPVFCSLPNSLTNLFPRVEAFAFQGQRAQNFPPRLDQVEVSCILGLKDKLPAGMVQAEQQHIGRPVCRQVVQDRIDLQIVWQPLIYFLQEIHKVLCRTARIRFGKNFPVNRFECAEGVAFSTSTIINLLLGSFSWLLAVWMMNQLMSRIAFCRSGPISSRQTVTLPATGSVYSWVISPFFQQTLDLPFLQTRFLVCASVILQPAKYRRSWCA